MTESALAEKVKRLAIIAIAALILAMGLIVILTPIVYDTDHFGDTLFILGTAWRHYQGLVPAIDFPHFYGGFTTWFIAQAFTLTGTDAHAFDYALVAIFVFFGVAAAAICWRRVSGLGFAITLLIIATLIFTRYPLEYGQAITSVVSTHSFLYNRIGLALVVLCGLYAGLPTHSRRTEVLGAVVVGILLVVAMTTKPTFVVIVPVLFLALVVQLRLVAVAVALVTFLAVMMLVDPWATGWQTGFQQGLAGTSGHDDNLVFGLIRKAVQVPLAQPVALTLVVAALGTLFLRSPRPWREVLGALLVAGGALGMTATMGAADSIGQLALPILAMLLVVFCELCKDHTRDTANAWQFATLVVATAFAVPHAANLLATGIEGWARRDQMLIAEGPLADYLSVPERIGPAPHDAGQYELLADGMQALKGLGDVSKFGIIADSGISFEFALLAEPVLDYPLWQNPKVPSLASGLPLPAGTDVILLGHGPYEDPPMGPVLRDKMTADFVLCRQTRYWQIYVRESGPGSANCAR